MSKAFSLASWNVEHFKNAPDRVVDVVGLLASLNPDIFALYEVEGKEVFAELVTRMPKYQFHITEGPEVQEILVGVRSGITAFFTQKIEFKSGASAMRPGALLTVTIKGQNYPILFLHLSSGPDPRGWGLRDDMLERALEFRRTLQKSAMNPEEPVNYIFLGDLNTMGMEYFFKEHNILADVEVKKIGEIAKKRNMRALTKNKPHTWSNGSKSRIKPSNLDHVVAADHLKFKQFNGADVRVLGWTEQADVAGQDAWIKRFSDHAILYFEVQRP